MNNPAYLHLSIGPSLYALLAWCVIHGLALAALPLSALDPAFSLPLALLLLAHAWLALPRLWVQGADCHVRDLEWRCRCLSSASGATRRPSWRPGLAAGSGRRAVPEAAELVRWRRLGPLFVLGLRDLQNQRLCYLPIVTDSLSLADCKALARYLAEQ
ncbi:MAG: hypothetical protein ACLFQH_04810 [Halothiobacillaceae bacterium]